jgi:serine/threonine protein kinase
MPDRPASRPGARRGTGELLAGDPGSGINNSMLIGRVLGNRYRIEEVIGRGGMGAVYRAIDERLGRQVAVKVITVSGDVDARGARAAARALPPRGARRRALPHHPNVVPVYDYGTDEALGLDYLVMELLQGRTSPTGWPLRPAAARRGARILHEAARGVAVGHRAGLIHRDVKPGNIFLAQSRHGRAAGAGGGLRHREADRRGGHAAQLTQDGAPRTPRPTPRPSSCAGSSQLTPASDVFSLGASASSCSPGSGPSPRATATRCRWGCRSRRRRCAQRNPADPRGGGEVVRRALAFEPRTASRTPAPWPTRWTRRCAASRTSRSSPTAPRPPCPSRTLPGEEDDDRTQLADEDDRTLLAPPPRPAVALRRPAHRPRRRSARRPAELPPRPPRQWEEPRTGVGGMVVWFLVFLVLAGAGMWAFLEWGRPGQRRSPCRRTRCPRRLRSSR